MSSSYNTPCIKHKLVVSIYWNTETSLAMSTLAIWCRVVRSRDLSAPAGLLQFYWQTIPELLHDFPRPSPSCQRLNMKKNSS